MPKKPKTASLLEFQGAGPTLAAARRDAEEKLQAFAKDALEGPGLCGFGGRIALVWRAAETWACSMHEPEKIGPISGGPAATTYGFTSRREAMNAAIFQMAQQAWETAVPDDAAFVAAAFPHADRDPDARRRAHTLADWIRFQRAYAALRTQGLSDRDAHERALRS